MPRLPAGIIPSTSQGYSYQGPGGVTRTQVAGGFPRYAMDYDRGAQTFGVTLVMDTYQHQMWTLFFYNEIKKGSLPFDMPLDSGLGVSDHTVNILPDSYSSTNANGTTWIVSFSVETESQAYLYPGLGALLLELHAATNGKTPEVVAALQKFATVDSNVLGFGL
jgi:hypothetical protein